MKRGYVRSVMMTIASFIKGNASARRNLPLPLMDNARIAGMLMELLSSPDWGVCSVLLDL